MMMMMMMMMMITIIVIVSLLLFKSSSYSTISILIKSKYEASLDHTPYGIELRSCSISTEIAAASLLRMFGT